MNYTSFCAELQGHDSELDGDKFDVVVCSAAYHHLESIEATTGVLAFFLKPGGYLLVVDFTTSDKVIPEDVPNRFGFSKDQICAAFEGAGLIEVDFEQLSSARFHGQTVDLFLARGKKSS
ncbi:Methyltransf-11 domain-containing protein [Mycena indigotica]|uniref:Methyltransf-11 domain-containing protein n=1 Tax=Mycena indigotica TaxID=2126181 RepID=A0A8H6S914_9AGAR|nr:Methyltransf-11 domain-containing protein [Mycena indigotica]KAF7294563.1 Methyltransf-11 domain-containing protein [Mycena indigotica]